ncbi:MAG: hypothetical protein KDD60_10310, partial [Bdellovibrionales bacterium]|nr:hypothetical protein [Bdellovibrionales bacterium]
VAPRVMISRPQGVQLLNLTKLPQFWELHIDEYPTRAKSLDLNADGTLLGVIAEDCHRINSTTGEEHANIHLYLFNTQTGKELLHDPKSEYPGIFLRNRENPNELPKVGQYSELLMGCKDTLFLLDGEGGLVTTLVKKIDRRGYETWETSEPSQEVTNRESLRANFITSPNRQYFACIADNGNRAEIFSGEDFRLLQIVHRSSDHAALKHIRFSPNGTQVILSDASGAIWECDL